MKRVESGIKGLDELIEGGFPEGSSVLVGGGPGAGKTIFGMQFIYEGAKMGEAGIYVTLESNLRNIVWNMQSFEWDIKSLQDQNLMRIYRLHLTSSQNLEVIEEQIAEELETISNLVKEINAKRIVIDSTTAFGVWITNPGYLRHVLFEFVNKLKDLGCTTLLITETKGGKTDFSAYGIEEFVVDAVVALYFYPPNRSIFIRKMRGTKHSKTVHPFKITDNGIDIKPRDEILWEALK